MALAEDDEAEEDAAPMDLQGNAIAAAPAGAGAAGEMESLWPRVIEYVKTKRMSTGIFLSEAQPVKTAGGVVTLGLPSEFQFHKETLEKDSNRKLVEEAFEVVSGKKSRVQFVILKAVKTEGEAGLPENASGDDSKMPDIILKAMDIFGGAKIVRRE